MVAGVGRIGRRGDGADVVGAGVIGTDVVGTGFVGADLVGVDLAAFGGGDIADSGLNVVGSAGSAKPDVSACFSPLESVLSRASTSPGDCSFVPSLHPTPIRATSASVTERDELCIGRPIRWESIGSCCDSCAVPARS
jgi:hypothetical protein